MRTADVLPGGNLADDLFYIGVTHRSAPPAVRENLHASPEKQRVMLTRLARLAPGCMVLATCERLELYASMTSASSDAWIAALADWFHVPAGLLARYAVTLHGVDVVEHWFRVAAGLDSRILGEPHVLGQVRAAYAQAAEAGSLDSILFALGRSAIRVGKRVRAETTINDARRSIATIAVEHLFQTTGHPSGASVVVTGTGHLASDVVVELTRRGTGRIVVAGRSIERARALALENLSRYGVAPASCRCVHGRQSSPLTKGGLRGVLRPSENLPQPLLVKEGGKRSNDLLRTNKECRGTSTECRVEALHLSELPQTVAVADVVISCTGAAAYVIEPAAIGTRRHRDLRVVDLSVPRNVDPDVGRLPRTTLTTLEDLLTGQAAHPTGVADAQLIMDEERMRFERWCRRRSENRLVLQETYA